MLDAWADPYLMRPPGRLLKAGDECAAELGSYQAGELTRPHRVVLVVIDLPGPKMGMRKLFPRHLFVVKNWRSAQRSGWDLVDHYRKRGTFEDRLGPFIAAFGNGLSAGSFAANEASLLPKLLAFNLAGMLRAELEDALGCGWDLRRVQQTVLKAGTRVVEHGRRVFVDLARAAGVLWERLLNRMQRWWSPRNIHAKRFRGRPPHPRHCVPPPRHADLSLVLRQ